MNSIPQSQTPNEQYLYFDSTPTDAASNLRMRLALWKRRFFVFLPNALDLYSELTVTSSTSRIFIGIIMSDTVLHSRLSHKNILISDETGTVCRIEFGTKFSQEILLFPGQIIACKGIRPVKSDTTSEYSILRVNHIWNNSPCQVSPLYPDVQLSKENMLKSIPLKNESPHKTQQPSQPVTFSPQKETILIASGPYNSVSNFSFKGLSLLTSQIQTHTPDRVILMGPFLNADNLYVKYLGGVKSKTSLQSTLNYEILFWERIMGQIVKLHKLLPLTKFHLVPSTQDIFHSTAFYPSSHFDFESQLKTEQDSLVDPDGNDNSSKNIDIDIMDSKTGEQWLFFESNPVSITINGILFNFSSMNIIDHILQTASLFKKTEEYVFSGEPSFNQIPQTLVEQASLYPLYPPSYHPIIHELCANIEPNLVAKLNYTETTPNVIVFSNDVAFASLYDPRIPSKDDKILLISPGRVNPTNLPDRVPSLSFLGSRDENGNIIVPKPSFSILTIDGSDVKAPKTETPTQTNVKSEPLEQSDDIDPDGVPIPIPVLPNNSQERFKTLKDRIDLQTFALN